MDEKEQAEIEKLWQKLVSRIEWDGGVLHRSSFEREVRDWLIALGRACYLMKDSPRAEVDRYQLMMKMLERRNDAA